MALGETVDKLLEKTGTREKVITAATYFYNSSCKDYSPEGHCNQNFKECSYAYIKKNDIKCKHNNKELSGKGVYA